MFDIISLSGIRNRETKYRTVVHRAFSPDAAPVPANDTLDGREPDTGALELISAMKTMERAEQLST
jgi:hypothetical protein